MTTFTDTSAPSDGVASQLWLPTSSYVCVIADLLADETDWEILSYILCHIPIQFANKHLLCGPRTRPIIQRLAETICNLLLSNQLAKKIVRTTSFPGMGEVQAVTYLALTTLMSYHTTFNVELKHALVKAFHMGLVGRYQTTIKPCLQALSIAAYELQPSMTRNLSEILDSMTRCVFNSNVTVHILELLSIFSTVPGLYANFTQAQYKLVFAIALKYIQHHNHSTAAGSWGPKESHALSQHVIGIAYYVIYCWFLAIKITDRRKHVPYISEQLLKANAGDSEIDPRSEVAFDWLARYTYADARPRPSQSFLREAVVGNPPEVVKEKTWLFRTSLVTIRALKRPGWFEIESRRPTGHTRFLCLLENLPLDLLEQLDDLVGDQSSVRDEVSNGP